MTQCAFCEKESELCDSHIIPAFAFKWKKSTGGTPYLRFSQNPNKRVQDGLKAKLLCRDCENLFGQFEKTFSERIFIPFTAGQVSKVRYSSWLCKFCCSVSWRLLTMLVRQDCDRTVKTRWASSITPALRKWRAFLEGREKHPGKFEQHLVFFPHVGETTSNDFPNNINRYLGRTIEFDFIHTERFFSTYCKIGPFLLFGFVEPYPAKWSGTRVAVNSGFFPAAKNEIPLELRDYLFERAKKQQMLISNLSPSQREKIEKEILSNVDRFSNSDQFRAMLHDAELFGLDAIISSK